MSRNTSIISALLSIPPIHSALFPTAQVTQQPGHLFWPPGSALTARLRRLVTAYQRSYKREQMKMEAAERGDRRRRRCEAAFKLKEIARREKQQRYSIARSLD